MSFIVIQDFGQTDFRILARRFQDFGQTDFRILARRFHDFGQTNEGMVASGEMEQGGAHGVMGEEEGLCGGGGPKKGRWQGSMRFGLDKNGRWTMGCVLTNPAKGPMGFQSKVLRFNGMTEEVRTVLEAHLPSKR